MDTARRDEKRNLETIPVGSLGLIPLAGCRHMGEEVDRYLTKWRSERESEHKDSLAFAGYERPTYIVEGDVPRFGNGEAKGVLKESVRGMDLYIMVDVCNYSMTYSLYGETNHMSPDDHFQNLKRIIAAVGGKARRITVIMPFLYESRQHRRAARESLDCAIALQELVRMGVDNIITFDAHDPRVQNAIPLSGFETIQPVYQFIKGLLRNVKDLTIDSDHMMIISPDEGGMKRAVYIANVLGLDMGMFYKRRDYTRIVDGRNPIIAHEFLGSSVAGKDVIIYDDMISSGESCLEVARALKDRKEALFPLRMDQFCHMHVLNSKTLSMLPHAMKFKAAGIRTLQIEAKAMEPAEISRIVTAYKKAMHMPANLDEAQEAELKHWEGPDITRGHFFRGVQ